MRMSKTKQQDPLQPEWSHKIDVAALPDQPFTQTIAASDDQCRDLARRIGVKAIRNLTAEIRIQHPKGSNRLDVSGIVHALVIQPCVVTFVDTEQRIDEPFESWFMDKEAAIPLIRARHEKMSRHADAEVPMLEESEDPEAIVDGQVDVGELAAQYLSLAVDPYPRAAGVSPEVTGRILEEKGVAEQSRNPFAALKDWKQKRKEAEEG